MKHAWIRAHRNIEPVKVMCQVLDVSTSGYYEAFGRAP